MRFDSVGLGYTARDGEIFVHYPTTRPDGTRDYANSFPIGLIPEHYRTAPPSKITAERVRCGTSYSRQKGADCCGHGHRAVD